ncbi:LysR family transcriptional regulator [Rhizobium phaseoli]|uniref:LysR family transcriptional regulator n=1 Tax=Rhizobium phaseoli TaxID=396 RepID=UPI0009B8C3FC|nr:hypothetical protein B5K03_26875 [Rhizobium phaseoli]
MERRLGFDLVRRHNGGITPTGAGAICNQQLTGVLEKARAGEQRAIEAGKK